VEGAPITEAAIRLLTAVTGVSAGPGLRLGVDACDVAVFRRQLTLASADHFVRTRFTDAEREYCQGRPERLAARWAAKEAVAKAIGSGFRGLNPGQIEVARQADGAPYVRPVGHNAWPFDAQRWKWAISLAHEGDLAVAVAVALADQDIEKSCREQT
jgi:holo-[acyl-carrier protein] synthase